MPRAPAPPRAGWCAGCLPRKHPAQTGYVFEGLKYCKPCFKALCPGAYEQKQSRRLQPCRICQKQRELLARVCRPCRKQRTCETCELLNETDSIGVCSLCSSGIALWCAACNSADKLLLGLCSSCSQKTCSACDSRDAVRDGRCAAPGCEGKWMLCQKCGPVLGMTQLCQKCWSASERLCKVCGKRKAREHISMHRCCCSDL